MWKNQRQSCAIAESGKQVTKRKSIEGDYIDNMKDKRDAVWRVTGKAQVQYIKRREEKGESVTKFTQVTGWEQVDREDLLLRVMEEEEDMNK